MKFFRRAPRLFHHRGVKEQSDSREEWGFLISHSLEFAVPLRRFLPLSKIGIDRQVAAEFAAILRAPVLRARERGQQFAKKCFDRFFFFGFQSACQLLSEKSRKGAPGLHKEREQNLAANRSGQFPVSRGSAQDAAAVVFRYVGRHKAPDDAVMHQRREDVVRERAAVNRKELAGARHGQILAARSTAATHVQLSSFFRAYGPLFLRHKNKRPAPVSRDGPLMT